LCAPGSQPEAAGATLLYLGTGGPEDPDDYGRLDRLTWRYFVINHPERGDLVLAFSTMADVIGVTRAVNGDAPFSMPTECRREAATPSAAPEATVVLDPTAEEVRHLLAVGRAEYRELEARAAHTHESTAHTHENTEPEPRTATAGDDATLH
jgi:hypothetical protein